MFQAHGLDARGQVVLRKRLARAKMLPFSANLPRGVIGLEPCGGQFGLEHVRAYVFDLCPGLLCPRASGSPGAAAIVDARAVPLLA